MKTLPRRNTPARGTTLLELLFVVLIIGILALLILPVIGKAKAQAKRTACVNNLHQIGIAEHVFAHDHGDKFPFQVSTNDGGTLEFARAGYAMSGDFFFAFRHFHALSNTLDLTRLLICPADFRTNADHFTSLRNVNISYFVGMNAEYTRPGSILGGDRNISSDSFGSGSILRLNPNAPVQWTSGSHQFKGNLLFADGHVERSDNELLPTTLQSAAAPVSDLLLPITPPSGGDGAGNSSATPTTTLTQSGTRSPNDPKPTTPATPTGVRPANNPRPVAPAPAKAAPRADAAAEVSLQTNPAPALAAQDADRKTARGATPAPSVATAAQASTGDPFNFYFFLFEPGLHFWSWLVVLLLVVIAAFGVGWHLQRNRARRRPAAADASSRG